MNNYPVLTLPPYVPPKNTSSSNSSNKPSGSSSATSQLATAGAGTWLPIAYGKCSIGAKIANVVNYSTTEVLILAAFTGNITTNFESIIIGDEVFAGDVNVYNGTQVYPDPWLKSKIAGYNDVLEGITYAAIRLSSQKHSASDISSIRAIINGQPLVDYQNPAYIIEHFATNYCSLSIDPDTLTKAAAHADKLVGGTKRLQIGLAISSRKSCADYLDILCEYAECRYHISDNTLFLYPHAPQKSSYTIPESDIIHADDEFSRESVDNTPNQIKVKYTVRSNLDAWTSASVTVTGDDVSADNVAEQVFNMGGFFTKAQAMRYAIQRLNTYLLCDLQLTQTVFYKSAIHINIGDVITTQSKTGVALKDFRVIDKTFVDQAHSKITLLEYSDAQFSDKVVADDQTGDTDLPDPKNPAPVTNLVAAEVIKKVQTGVFNSYIDINFDADPAAETYEVLVFDLSDTDSAVYSTKTNQTKITTPALPEYKNYRISVKVINHFGFKSTPAITNVITDGKLNPPSDVAIISELYEEGGLVFAKITPAIDDDIIGYEWRVLPVGAPWDSEHKKVIDILDSLTLKTRDIAPGVWDVAVKAVDSVKNRSVNDTRRSIVVDNDTAASNGDVYNFNNFYLNNVVEVYYNRIDNYRHFVSRPDKSFNDTFKDPLNSYNDPVLSYNAPRISSVVTETKDWGKEITGNFVATANSVSVADNVVKYLELSTDNNKYSTFPMSAKTKARYSRIRVASNDYGVLMTKSPLWQISAFANQKSETGSAKSSASDAVTVYLKKEYYDYDFLTITPISSTPVTHTVEDVSVGVGVVSSFKVSIYQENNSRVVRDFNYKFEGK